ncbi:Hint domain-containing protein [Sulfitobacter brevis]|uniref:Hint domain-containing protein n=1 Tax=Sulfitobacter brevis TaxID=74348 RepID=A0A1I2EH81_9RHOB|nr:Hint domain-containing protein [Sulfitobacter brevis]SFE92033.1 Hint domain-containing protein [Sulfitobacter brevis]
MVTRSFVAFDNDNFSVISSPNGALVGSGIINNSNTPDGTVFTYTSGSRRNITIEDDSTDPDIFEDNELATHRITDGGGLVPAGTFAEAESLIYVRALDTDGVPTGPTITLTVLSQAGNFSDIWGVSANLPLRDGVSYVKTDGDNDGSSRYNSFVTCFAAGTRIDTPYGPRAVETLQPGDLVTTQEHGAKPVRWAGGTRVSGMGNFAPVRFSAGRLGHATPLEVSPEHRMLIEHPAAELLFGSAKVLVAAKFLVGLAGVTRVPMEQIAYFHIMFDHHEILRAAGCWSESFFLAENSLGGLDADARAEMMALFPSLKAGQQTFGASATMVLKAHEAELLCRFLQRDEGVFSRYHSLAA